MTRAINFNAGPVGPPARRARARASELLDFEGSGMSVMEHSHRGKDYEKRPPRGASRSSRELPAVPSTDGMSSSSRAARRAVRAGPDEPARAPASRGLRGRRRVGREGGLRGERRRKTMGGGEVHVAADIDARRTRRTYARRPRRASSQLTSGAAYVHVHEQRDDPRRAVRPRARRRRSRAGRRRSSCDMSSDILSRPLDVSRVRLHLRGRAEEHRPERRHVVVHRAKDLVARGRKDIPAIFQYRTHAENQSLFNTPPTFGDLPGAQRPPRG